jgi:hypothetical protein
VINDERAAAGITQEDQDTVAAREHTEAARQWLDAAARAGVDWSLQGVLQTRNRDFYLELAKEHRLWAEYHSDKLNRMYRL